MKPRSTGVIVDFKKDARQDLGYVTPKDGDKRPPYPWSREVIPKSKVVSPHESPLKEWWLKQQQEKRKLWQNGQS